MKLLIKCAAGGFKMKKIMRNKKGDIKFLLEHIVGVIISILCIIILIGIGYKIYNMFSEKSDLEKAEGNLKVVKERIQMLKDSPSVDSIEVIIYPPTKWILRSYNDKYPYAECYSKKSCLCLCKKGSCANNVPKVCYGMDFVVEIPSSFEVPAAWYDLSQYFYEAITYENSIGLYKSAEGLKVYKSDNSKIIIEQIIVN